MEHFKIIADNKFEPENICKLTTNFTNVKESKKYIQMGEVNLQTREDDASPTDIKRILQLLSCFLIYVQILKHFTNPALKDELDKGIMFYIDRLIKHAHVRTWESVRSFHFLFHRTCLTRGITNPEVWKDVDQSLENQHLVLRQNNQNGGHPSNRGGPSTSANRNQQGDEVPVCFRFNGKGCNYENCRFKHAMGTCRNNNTTPIGSKRE